MPFPDASVSLLCSSLGDPFNTDQFWAEAARVLRPTGHLIYTTPSWEWAEGFRRRQQEPPDAAEFLLRDGRRVLMPSLVYPERDQIALIESCGLIVADVYHVLRNALRDHLVSAKLERGRLRTPIVTGYLASPA
jgi:SAM-dependent methyltransferase